jgi:hypothetical protein
MIPPLASLNPGALWRTLPPGIHNAALSEVATRYATTPHRRALTMGLVRVAHSLRIAGGRILYLDGSYTSDKVHPGDFDGCFDPGGIDWTILDPVLQDFTLAGRAAQKLKYQGELFISSMKADSIGTTYLDYFQKDKDTGLPKGILKIEL